MTSRVGQILWPIISLPMYILLCGPIALYIFFKHVYEFGPEHRRRPISQILFQPVPPKETGIQLDSGKRVTRFLPNPVPRIVARNTRLCSREDVLHQRSLRQRRRSSEGRRIASRQYRCPNSKITPVAQKHHMYSMYSTTHATTMGFGNTDAFDGMAMEMTLYFAINNFSCPDILFHELPKKPPDGILTELFVVSAVAVIYLILTIKAYIHLLCRPSSRDVQGESKLPCDPSDDEDDGAAASQIEPIMAYTTSAENVGAADFGDNNMASFDSDSSFWVCDNSATGHICNNRSLFLGKLEPSKVNVGSANGVSTGKLMGKVRFSVLDDEGVSHRGGFWCARAQA